MAKPVAKEIELLLDGYHPARSPEGAVLPVLTPSDQAILLRRVLVNLIEKLEKNHAVGIQQALTEAREALSHTGVLPPKKCEWPGCVLPHEAGDYYCEEHRGEANETGKELHRKGAW